VSDDASFALPPGYTRASVGRVDAVCHADAVHAVVDAVVEARTLYAYAERHPERQAFRGRAPTYAAPLPQGAGRVVVRHAWHGGLLRGVTRDLYLPPTRAPGELRMSEWLRAAGVRTPRVVAYVRYPAPLGLCRVDVATELVPDGRDLAAVLRPAPDDHHAAALRDAWTEATADLVAGLTRLGARHPDLNLKNVLLARDEAGATRAWVLDVDVVRVTGCPPSGRDVERVYRANVQRLARSLDKWRATRGLPVDVDEMNALFARVADLVHPGSPHVYIFSASR
jgi:3-deoxy-D-manno-octulosonic acid kinase